jgi:hypothetical protein
MCRWTSTELLWRYNLELEHFTITSVRTSDLTRQSLFSLFQIFWAELINVRIF